MNRTCSVVLCALAGCCSAFGGELRVDQFGLFETRFETAGQYDNPYRHVEATARLTRPDGSDCSAPLFWDGGKVWRLRVSPDATGQWTYAIRSTDEGIDGRTGGFACVASDGHGGLQAMPDYPRHFQRQDGTPFLFWGDTAWALYLDNEQERLSREAVFHYIDKRAGEGVNVMHSMLLSEAGWGNRGGPPFMDLEHERINPGYWREVDLRVQELNAGGIVGGLVLAWGDKGRNEPYAWRKFPDVAARKRYARYIAARYGAFDVYFIVAGEWHAEIRTRSNTNEQAVKDEFIEIGDTLATADAHDRMIGIHPMTQHGSTRDFNEAAWMSFGDYQQNYRDLHGRILESRSTGKPIVNSEYGYFLRDQSGDGYVDKPNSLSVADMRHATWDVIMAGGYPVTGYGTTYMGGYRDPGPFNPDDPRNDAWARQYAIAKSFLSGLQWWKLAPLDEAISCVESRSGDRQIRVGAGSRHARTVVCPPARTYWMMVDPGRQYVAYARGVSQPLSLRLDQAEGLYDVRLMNPRTGDLQSLGKARKMNPRFRWSPPDDSDWVIQIVRKAAGPPTKGELPLG